MTTYDDLKLMNMENKDDSGFRNDDPNDLDERLEKRKRTTFAYVLMTVIWVLGLGLMYFITTVLDPFLLLFILFVGICLYNFFFGLFRK